MMPIFALWAVVQAAVASVSGLAVAPVDDRTEVAIAVDGAVTWNDFAMSDPARIVIDVNGSRNALRQQRYLGLDRGGVRAIRVSQYQPEVVRIVIDLAAPAAYTVDASGGALRVRFANPAGGFEPWRTGDAPAGVVAAQPAPAAAPQQPIAYAAQDAPLRPPPGRPITVYFEAT
ncbi:MAG TPA: AMIN domain-containing protein, partial [Planctomycetota bacterium]|nr:AMIN domain-containing protein [Planctomycetota bacterium]